MSSPTRQEITWGSTANICVALQGRERRKEQSHDTKLSGHRFRSLHPPLSGQRRPAYEHEGRRQNHNVRLCVHTAAKSGCHSILVSFDWLNSQVELLHKYFLFKVGVKMVW